MKLSFTPYLVPFSKTGIWQTPATYEAPYERWLNE